MSARVEVDAVITRIATGQHGLVTREQLMAAGVPSDTVRSRVRHGRLEPVQRGVYRVGPLESPRQGVLAAVLACGRGAAVSHASAGSLRNLLQDEPTPGVDVTVPRRAPRRRPGVRLHRVPGGLAPQDVGTVDGVPVTTVARTVFDLASSLDSRGVRRLLGRALREHPECRARIEQLVAQQPRRKGAALLRLSLSADAPPPFTRSAAEERLLGLIERTHLPRPEVNVRIAGCEVDFLWRRERLVVEVDGYAYHSGRRPFATDRRRGAALSARGFQVVRLAWEQIDAEPEGTLVLLGQALALAGAGAAGRPRG